MKFSLFSALQNTKQQLRSISATPALDAEILLAHLLHKPRSYLYAHPEQMLTPQQQQQYSQLIFQRQQGSPIAYIVGKKEFWSLELFVNEHVLIPRHETELLVETALQLLPANEAINLADLGTGSGAIALALASERPQWQIYATDNSESALEVAKKNAKNLNITNIEFLLGHWCEALPTIKFEAIVSNPPYIAADDPELDKYVAKYEPKNALITPTGLEAIETIMQQAPAYLSNNGLLLIEHGYKQTKAIVNLFKKYGFKRPECRQDYAGKDRISFAYK